MFKKLLLLTAAATALVGCGGTSVPEARPAAQIDGTAADNIIRNGNVRVYRFDGQEREILLTTKTDNYGYYADPLQSESQFIKVCVIGGEYTEEASSINIKLEGDDRLCAISYWESGQQQQIMVTPETNLATALIEYEVKQGKGNLQNIVSGANTKIGTIFGYNIITTKPEDMTSDQLAYVGLNDSVRSGLWHAAFSRIALQAAIANGQKTHTSLISSMTLHKALYNDLKADGKLNGWGVAENGVTKVRLGLGNYPLNAKVYRTELARELVKFVQSDRNKTAVKPNDVLAYATSHSLSTDSIWDDKDIPVPFDDEAPVVAFDTPEHTYISRQYALGLKITDFSGVKSVTYTVNGGSSEVFDFTQPKLILNTERYNDGDLELALTVVDDLDNTAVVKRIFRVANKQPIVNIASKTLVNSRTYAFKANVGEVKAGVASVSVAGKTADYADNVVTANLSLQNGQNTLAMILTDNTGAEHNYSFTVNVDAQAPDIRFSTASWLVRFKVSDKTYEEARFTENVSTKLYITPKHFKLGNMAVTEENLSAEKWPTLRFEVADAAIGGNYASTIDNLKMSLKIVDTDGFTQFERGLTIPENGLVLVPVSEEFLGSKWYEDKGFLDGRTKVVFTLVDEAGNSTNYPWTPRFIVSNPSIDMGLDIEQSQLSGNQKIYFNGKDLIDTDLIIDLDGKSESTIQWPQDFYELDTTKLDDGAHYITVAIRSDGVIVKTIKYEFSVDNTPPSITFNSAVLTKSRNYTITGNVVDLGSGLKNLNIDGKQESWLNAGAFNKSMSLADGINTIQVDASDIAGNTAKASHSVMYDSAMPVFKPVVIDGKITGVETQEWKLWDDTMIARYGIADPSNVLELKLEFARYDDKGNLSKPLQPFYLDDENNNLQGVRLEDVGGVLDAIKNDGSLNTLSHKADFYLFNKRIPFFAFYAADAYPDKTLSDLNKVKVYYKVTYGSDVIIQEELLRTESPLSDTKNYYILPLTQEFFTHQLLDFEPQRDVIVTFELHDEAGNVTEKEYRFNVFNAANRTAVKPALSGGLNRTGLGRDNLNLKVAAEAAIGLSRVNLNDTADPKNNFEWSALESAPLKVIQKVEIPAKSKSADGQHSWTLSVTDLAGNTTTKNYSAGIDKTPPVLNISAPSGVFVGDYTTFSWSASDLNINPKNFVTASFNGKNIYISENDNKQGKGEKLIYVNDAKEGNNNITLTATDAVGNVSTKTITVNWHKTKPASASLNGKTVTINGSGKFTFISGCHTWYPDMIPSSCQPVSVTMTGMNTFTVTETGGKGEYRFKDELGLEFGVRIYQGVHIY